MREKILKEILGELYKSVLLNELNRRSMEKKISLQPDLKEAFEKQLLDLEQELRARQSQIEVLKEMQNEKN